MISAWLLALALATAAPSLHAASVGPQSNSFITSDNVRLHLLEAGEAKPGQPVILFIPGWSMPASIWMKQLEALSATHKVMAIDPRGQGESEIPASGYTTERRAEDLRDLVDYFAPVVLVTWSLGALEALQYVHRHGDKKLSALVIVDSSIGEHSAPMPVMTPLEPPPPPVPGPQLSFAQELRLNRPKAIEDFLRAIFRKPLTDEAHMALRDAALRMPLEASLSIFPGSRIPRERWRRTVHAFTKPLLYAITPQYAGQAESLRQKRPGTRIEVFEDAGHALFVDEPARFSALLAAFLAQHKLMGGAAN